MTRQEAISKWIYPAIATMWNDKYVKKILAALEQEPKTGHWIYGEHDVAMCDGYWCDKCGFFVPWDYEHKFIDFINDFHFCPNCGAKMESEER